MCGIVGIGFLGSLSKEEEIVRQEIAQYFLTELIVETQTRGEDATGMSIVFDNGHYVGLKSGISAVDFITKKNEDKDKTFTGLMNIWSSMVRKKNSPKNAKIVLAHCRKSSVGNSYDNTNNHPIHVDPIIGVHNGTLTNDDVVFRKLGCKRDGQVDSEAIMHLVHKHTNKGSRPFDLDTMKSVAEKLSGSFTTLFANSNNPYQIGFMREDRPLDVCLIKKLNMLVFTSDQNFIKKVLFRYMKLVDVFPNMFQDIKLNWPSLTSKDVAFKVIPNTEVGFFDLTETVAEKKDVVADFMIRENLPRTIEGWKVEKTYSGYQGHGTYQGGGAHHGHHNHYNSIDKTGHHYNKDGIKVNDRRTTVAGAKPTTDTRNSSTGKEKVVGRVWINSLKKFTDVTSKEIEDVCKNENCIELEVTSKESKVEKAAPKHVLTTITSDLPSAKPAGKDKNDMVVEEMYIKTEGTERKAAIERSKMLPPPAKDKVGVSEYQERLNNEFSIISVDMSNDPVAIDFSERYRKKLKHFDSRKEVAAALGLENENALNNLSVVPLVNRAYRKFSGQGYNDGFVAGRKYSDIKKEEEDKNSAETYKDRVVVRKGKKRDLMIKNYKLLTQILSEITHERSSGKTVGSVDDYVRAVVHKHINQIDVEVIKELTKTGGIKEDEVLKSVNKHVVSMRHLQKNNAG